MGMVVGVRGGAPWSVVVLVRGPRMARVPWHTRHNQTHVHAHVCVHIFSRRRAKTASRPRPNAPRPTPPPAARRQPTPLRSHAAASNATAQLPRFASLTWQPWRCVSSLRVVIDSSESPVVVDSSTALMVATPLAHAVQRKSADTRRRQHSEFGRWRADAAASPSPSPSLDLGIDSLGVRLLPMPIASWPRTSAAWGRFCGRWGRAEGGELFRKARDPALFGGLTPRRRAGRVWERREWFR